MTSPSPARSLLARSWRAGLQLGLILLVVGSGWGVMRWLIATKPKAATRPPVREARLVEVRMVQPGPQSTRLSAMGLVQPAREGTVATRVAGAVARLDAGFEPGAVVAEGSPLLWLDEADYLLTARRAEADRAQALAALAIEQGQQTMARSELELVGTAVSDEEKALILRQPQMEQAQANVAQAEAALELARLHLERTQIQAPFEGVILSRLAAEGQHLAAGAPVARMAGADRYWIRVSIPVDQLRWIRFAEDGEASPVRIYNDAAWGPERFRPGRVLRLLGDVEADGRMAQVLVDVPDPLGRGDAAAGAPRLLLGDFVRVEIEGLELDSAVALDRALLRDGDQVWIMNAEDRLETRRVKVAFRGSDTLLITEGLQANDRVVATDLPGAVDGMLLRTEDGAKSLGRAEERIGP